MLDCTTMARGHFPKAPPLNGTEDLEVKQIALRAADGDQEALLELYDRFYRKTLGILGRQCGFDNAQDLCQTFWLKVPRKLSTFRADEDATFSTWLCRAALNHGIDFLRRRREEDRRRVELDEAEWLTIPGKPDSSEQIARGEQRCANLVKKIRGMLKEKDFLLWHLVEVDGCSYREVMEALQLCEGTMKSSLHRIRRILRRKLEADWLALKAGA